MKVFFSLCLTLGWLVFGRCQTTPELRVSKVAEYLDSIRSYPAALTAFFAQMPKGGDLHHHFTGSVYPETYLDAAEKNGFWVHPETQAVVPAPPAGSKRRDWLKLTDWEKQLGSYEVRRRLLRHWSTLDFFSGEGASYDDFFNTFPRFDAASDVATVRGLLEIKTRALEENVQYIETMYQRIPCSVALNGANPAWDDQLLILQRRQDTRGVDSLLTVIFNQIQRNGYQACVESYNTQLERQHQELGLDEPGFKLRYQNYVIRVVPPTDVFAALVVAFASATASSLIEGVNIVAPEHDPVALRDYWLHMQMYQFCHQRFPRVRYAMHAGELRLGITSPENLRWHIRSAIEVAGASRIGHGVDIAHEEDPYGLLALMKQRQVAVEINLSSNDFILGVAGGDHPILLYHRAGVPMVISTDDAGVLRTNLTEQYVRLARDYPEFSYSDIKQLVYNSIQYSFLEDAEVKKQLLRELDIRFGQFEKKVLKMVAGN